MKKKYIIAVLFALCMQLAIHAENYPYRSDYLWVTRPDHADWLYDVGEKAVVDVEFYRYGMPVDGVVDYKLADDMLASDDGGSVKLKDGKCRIVVGTRRVPGFRDVRLSLTIDGHTYRHHVKIGFAPEKIRPYTEEPSDFVSYWRTAIADMRKKTLKYTCEPADEYTTDKMDCRLLKIDIDGAGHTMYGYLFVPKHAKPASCPVMLCPPGAGIKTIKEPLRHKYYAENGFVRLEIEIHGLDPRLPQTAFDEMSRAFNGRDGGYLAVGIESRDRYYMRHVYLGLVRCIDLLTSLPEWDGRNVAVQGGSQGGALALVAAGLDERVTQCVVNHPALSDMAAYIEPGRTGGYPHFCRIAGLLDSRTATTLAYYDVVNFSRHVKAPVYMTWGYNDDVCPPTTSYAVWNTLTCPKESLITPINEHWTSDNTEYGQMLWIKDHLK